MASLGFGGVLFDVVLVFMIVTFIVVWWSGVWWFVIVVGVCVSGWVYLLWGLFMYFPFDCLCLIDVEYVCRLVSGLVQCWLVN